ncbi:MAG TPA: c-type cytochrome [Planctomycetota bacterium]|nr:c-type cytochrome [Planctomycetota bacterium]
MKFLLGFLTLGAVIAPLAAADTSRGQTVFITYCAACHGPEGAGLVGPNLTDTVFLHGGTKPDIVKTLTNGVGDKGMPAWGAILPPADLDAVADFAVSLIGKNLKSPFAMGESSVTPFPKGSVAFPLLMRTFMPPLGLDPTVLAHHSHGQVIAKYSPEKGGDVDGDQKPVDGIPSAIAVSFGDGLSYCFDTTECRLLYTWSGPFMDMTNYWGPGSGGGRKSFNYVPVVAGPVWWRTSGAESLQVPGVTTSAPHFTGYHKTQNVPELQWRIGDVQIALRVIPGTKPGEAVCRYTTTGAAKGVVFVLPTDSAEHIKADKGTRAGTTLTLSAADAAQFTLTISPGDKPVVEAPKLKEAPKPKDPAKTGKDDRPKPKVEEKE